MTKCAKKKSIMHVYVSESESRYYDDGTHDLLVVLACACISTLQ